MRRIFLDTSAYSAFKKGHPQIRHRIREASRAGAPIPTNDVWIAASAMQCGSVLLTTDPHFRAVTQIVAEVVEPQLGSSKPGKSGK